ncbi:hypothetical protein KKG41_00235 [Patescibacteria group bacterium]|nr:hypothetical protein [Patescibacteria group bacterium]MBU1890652.1 hypothetical protein [Patescibacteria group bacterium]
MFIALFLVAIGVIYLLKNTGIITGGVWDIVWPSIIIIFGISIVFKQKRKKHWWDFFDNKSAEDWEQWGKSFGEKMEDLGKGLEKKYREHPEEWEEEFGQKIGQKIKSFFEGKENKDN